MSWLVWILRRASIKRRARHVGSLSWYLEGSVYTLCACAGTADRSEPARPWVDSKQLRRSPRPRRLQASETPLQTTKKSMPSTARRGLREMLLLGLQFTSRLIHSAVTTRMALEYGIQQRLSVVARNVTVNPCISIVGASSFLKDTFKTAANDWKGRPASDFYDTFVDLLTSS
jgi:hypothetical protein